MDGVSEELNFDISGALQGIGSISDALDQVVQTFQVGLADALSTLTNVGADVTPLADSLDVAGLGPAVDTAIADATSDPFGLTLDADATPVTDAIDQATSEPQTVPVEADTTSATQAIDGLDSTPITLEVDADTTGAQDALDDLGDSATQASGGGSSGLAGLAGNLGSVSTATELATGNVKPLAEGFASVGAGAAAAVAGGAAFGAFIGETTKLAADADAQNQRFANTFGVLADQVSQIHVGGLNTDIETLGKQSGTTDADLKAVASRIGALGQSAGASSDTIVKTTDNLLALGATFSVNNPRLGDAASVTDRLTNAFARGGRALAPFGLALSSAQINAEALSETGKSSAADLTLFEKSTAGANLAVRIFGDTLGTKFQQGAQSADVQFRALKVSIEETLIAVGGPLLQPLVTTLTDVLPIAQQVGIVLGDLGRITLPLVAAAAPLLAPLAGILKLAGDALGGIATLLNPLDSGFGTLVIGLGAVVAVAPAVVESLQAMFIAGSLSLGPVGWVALGIGLLATLGGALDLFGRHTHQAAIDTTDLNTAFSASSDSATTYAQSLGSANKAIDAFLTKNLAVKTAGVSGTDVINNLGVSFQSVASALGGSEANFQTFQSNITTLQANTNQSSGAFDHFHDTLLAGRQALEDNAQASVAAAEASGQITAAQVKEAAATAGNTGQHDDYGHAIVDNLAVLQALAPTIDANTRAQTTNATATAQASPAYARLVQQLAAGKISTDTFAGSLTQFGFTADEASAFTTTLQSSVTSLVSTIEADLPKASDAFKDLTAASDPTQLATNLQAQTAQINQFVGTIEQLRTEGHDKLATFFAEQGVGALTQAQQAAGDSAVAATDATALRLNQAAHAAADRTGVELAAGEKVQGEAAGKAIVQGIADALTGDTSAEGAAKKKGADTGDAFKPDLAKGTKAGITAATNSLLGASIGLTLAATQVGNEIGAQFDSGFAQGITLNTPEISTAATAAAQAAETAAKAALKSKSPSLVAKQIGGDFSTGLAIGIVDQAPQAVDASTVLANAVVKQLQDALRAATSGSSSGVQTAAQSAFTSFLSNAGSSLTSVGTDISTFAQTIISTTQAQDQAFKEYKKALAGQADDQKKVQELQAQTGIAYGVLTVAMQHYNALAATEPKKASDAQKLALTEAKSALSAAQSQFDSFSNKLDSANSRLKDAAKNLQTITVEFSKATHAQDAANDPSSFTKNLRATNAEATQFAKDIATLFRRGDTDLAKQLADAGPEAGAALARGFARAPLKAKSAEAAIDAANTFATNYQDELTRLFGPSGGAVSAAQTAGQTIGQALTTGLQVSSQAGTAAALASLSAQIAAGVPQVIPLVAAPQIQKALTPVAANAPTIIQTPTLAGQAGTQSLELDLTIVLDDGRTVTAQTSVPIAAPSRTLKQLVRASVHAS